MTKAEAAQIRADLTAIYVHVAEDARGDYLMNHPQGTNLRVLIQAVPPFDRPFEAEHFAALEMVVGWIRFVMRWRARELTPRERHVAAAAERVAAALPRASPG